MYNAFSREETKVYVQHLLREQALEVRDLIMERGACVYICGDAHRMAVDVFKTMTQIIAEYGRFESNPQDAETYLGELKKTGRWSEDVW
jgi:sulfite reductase alpha subunit-like flavoprotein